MSVSTTQPAIQQQGQQLAVLINELTQLTATELKTLSFSEQDQLKSLIDELITSGLASRDQLSLLQNGLAMVNRVQPLSEHKLLQILADLPNQSVLSIGRSKKLIGNYCGHLYPLTNEQSLLSLEPVQAEIHNQNGRLTLYGCGYRPQNVQANGSPVSRRGHILRSGDRLRFWRSGPTYTYRQIKRS